MSSTLWVLSVFTNDVEQTEKWQQKYELKTAKLKNIDILLLSLRIIDPDIVPFIYIYI